MDVALAGKADEDVGHHVDIGGDARDADPGSLLHLEGILFSNPVGTAETPLLEEGDQLLIVIIVASLYPDLLGKLPNFQSLLVFITIVPPQALRTKVVIADSIVEHIIHIIRLLAFCIRTFQHIYYPIFCLLAIQTLFL